MARRVKQRKSRLRGRIEQISDGEARAPVNSTFTPFDAQDPGVLDYVNEFGRSLTQIQPMAEMDLMSREGALAAVKQCEETLAMLEKHRKVASALTTMLNQYKK